MKEKTSTKEIFNTCSTIISEEYLLCNDILRIAKNKSYNLKLNRKTNLLLNKHADKEMIFEIGGNSNSAYISIQHRITACGKRDDFNICEIEQDQVNLILKFANSFYSDYLIRLEEIKMNIETLAEKLNIRTDLHPDDDTDYFDCVTFYDNLIFIQKYNLEFADYQISGFLHTAHTDLDFTKDQLNFDFSKKPTAKQLSFFDKKKTRKVKKPAQQPEKIQENLSPEQKLLNYNRVLFTENKAMLKNYNENKAYLVAGIKNIKSDSEKTTLKYMFENDMFNRKRLNKIGYKLFNFPDKFYAVAGFETMIDKDNFTRYSPKKQTSFCLKHFAIYYLIANLEQEKQEKEFDLELEKAFTRLKDEAIFSPVKHYQSLLPVLHIPEQITPAKSTNKPLQIENKKQVISLPCKNVLQLSAPAEQIELAEYTEIIETHKEATLKNHGALDNFYELYYARLKEKRAIRKANSKIAGIFNRIMQFSAAAVLCFLFVSTYFNVQKSNSIMDNMAKIETVNPSAANIADLGDCDNGGIIKHGDKEPVKTMPYSWLNRIGLFGLFGTVRNKRKAKNQIKQQIKTYTLVLNEVKDTTFASRKVKDKIKSAKHKIKLLNEFF